MPGRSAFAVTHSLTKAKQRYPWAKAWVQVRGGIWCFESEQEARLYGATETEEVTALDCKHSRACTHKRADPRSAFNTKPETCALSEPYPLLTLKSIAISSRRRAGGGDAASYPLVPATIKAVNA